LNIQYNYLAIGKNQMYNKIRGNNMAIITNSDRFIIGTLTLLFIIYLLLFGKDALKYLIA